MRSVKLNENIEAAIAAVIAFIVSMIPIEIGPSFGVQISLAIIYIVAFRRGIRAGLLSGFLLGLIKFISGFASILTPVQGIIEYIFAFALAGLAGIFALQIQEAAKNNHEKNLFLYVGLATFIAIFAEYFVHFLAGVAFWGQFAPEGMPFFLPTETITFSAIAFIIIGFLGATLSGLQIRKAEPMQAINQGRM